MNVATAPSSVNQMRAVLQRLESERALRKAQNRLEDYHPYGKQAEFHAMGATKRERLFLAGNQLGKTLAGGFEAAMHLTGRYPDWWEGRRFDHPVACWVGGITGETTRDGPQRILLGRGESYGQGTIPAKSLHGAPLSRQGVAEAIAIQKVRHVSGGISTIIFKSYDQGRQKWQGDTIDFVWFDEEPDDPGIYTEGLTRTNAGDEARGGIAFMTFTPLLGMSEVVNRFVLEQHKDRGTVTMTIDDVEHYSDEQKATIIDSYPAHEREARAKGVPTLGSGKIFPITEESILWRPVPLPRWVRSGIGLDFGWDHPTAAIRMEYDPEPDIFYLTGCYRRSEQTPIIHAAAIKSMCGGKKIPIMWPHDGLQHDKGSGIQLAQQYRDQDLEMHPDPVTFLDGSNGVEAGVSEMLTRMQTGRWKVAEHLQEWWEEFRLYHRKPVGPLGIPQIFKKRDDAISASRYGMMGVRFFREVAAANDDAYSRGAAAGGGSWKTA